MKHSPGTKILVIVAHPDDEVLGCGGTITKMAREGHAVYIAILGEGITSRYEHREDADQRLVKSLNSKSKDVARLLGANKLFTHNFPDNRFDTLPLLDIIKIVEKHIDLVKPDVIYTHHGGDLNIDHAITHRAVLTATRPLQGSPVRELCAFEVPSSTEWAFHRLEPFFRPNVFVDISNTLDIKIKALSYYESEKRTFPHPRSSEAIITTARRWGTITGCKAAEAFELIRSLR